MSGPRSTSLVLALAAGGVALGWATLTTGHDWGGDFAGFLLQARGVWEGAADRFVEFSRFAIERSRTRYPLGPVAYPWGTPILLAPLVGAVGLEPLALKTLNLVCWGGFLATLGLGFRRRHPPLLLGALVGLFAFNPTLLGALDEILADVPFLFLSTAAVVAIDRIELEGREIGPPWAGRLLLGMLLSAAYLVRGNGILLLPVLATAQAVGSRRDRRRPGPLEALPYAVFAGVVLASRLAFPGGGTYAFAFLLDGLGPRLLIENARYYATLPADFFAGLPLPGAFWAAFLALALLGVRRNGWRDAHLVVYCGITVALFLGLKTPPEGIRYLFPILPFGVHLALSGLETLVAPVGSTTVRATLRALPLTIAVLLGLRSAGAAAENLRAGRVRPDGPFAPPALELWSAIGRHVPAGESVVFFKPRVLSLLADRPSAALGRAALALEHGYVAIRLRPGGTQLSPDAADSLRAIGRLEEVWRNGDFRLFRTVSEPPAGSD